jgi:hypothetical protein
MRTGFADPRLFPNARLTTGTLRFIESANPGIQPVTTLASGRQLAYLNPEEIVSRKLAGKELNLYTSSTSLIYYPPPNTTVRLLKDL